MRGLDPAVASKLAKIAGRLGSDFDGERAAAAAAATRILRDHGMTWTDLVLAGAAAPTRPPPPVPPQGVARQILLGRRHLLSDWEVRFAENLARWRGRPTPKQLARLAQLRAELESREAGR